MIRLNFWRMLTLVTLQSVCLTTFAVSEPLPGNLYQVEMIVFERLQHSESVNGEHWPKNLELRYPNHWQKLVSPAEANGASAGELALYQFLPQQQLQLSQQKKRLERSNQLRTLFHEAWIQPLVDIADAPAVIISGGGRYGDHHELEGSLTLGISRYLHVHTDLWMTHFVANFGQQSEHWPELPALPTEQGHLHSQDASNETHLDASLPDESKTQAFPLQNGADYPASNTLVAEEDPYAALIESPYLIRETVTLKHKRRMRSHELHYLDHPRMGVLVLIKPAEL